MNKNISISIIIPVFNSQATIYLLIKKIIAELDKNLEFEIILINDNSADLSELECIRAYNDYLGKWLAALKNSTNTRSAKFFRIINEIPTVILIIVVFLAIFKPI